MKYFTVSFLIALKSTLDLLGCQCVDALVPINELQFRPRSKEIQFKPLTDISTLNYRNISELYTRVLECDQLVSTLKNVMAKRLNESVPPPHHHCFLQERELTNKILKSLNHNTTLGLHCDLHMLRRFTEPLQRAINYEVQHFRRRQASTMLKVKMMLEDIDSALFNLTGLNSSAVEMMDAAICGRGEAPSLNSDPPENTAGGGVEERTGGQRLRTQEPPTSAVLSPPEADPTDLEFLNQLSQNEEEEVESTPTATTLTTAPPTAATPIRCRMIENDTDQFIYIYELWMALYYTSLDICQKKNCLQD